MSKDVLLLRVQIWCYLLWEFILSVGVVVCAQTVEHDQVRFSNMVLCAVA